MEHFVRVKKRRDMEDHNYFVPHRTDSIETYVSWLIRINYDNNHYIIVLYSDIIFFICIYSCTRTRLLKFEQKSFTKLNLKEIH